MALLSTSIDLVSGSWLLLLTTAAIAYYAISSIIARRRLRHFKGPFLASFSYMWLIRALGSGRMAEWFTEANSQYGAGSSSTVRIGPNELITTDPEVIRRTSGARSKYTRSGWYKMNALDPNEDAMFNTLSTATHDKIKAQTAPGYAGKENPGLEGEVDLILAQLVDKIRTKYAGKRRGERSNRPLLDLAIMSQFFTLDSIAKIAFGQEFGLIRKEKDLHGHLKMLEELALTISVASGVPYLRSIMGSKLVLHFAAPKPGDKKGIGRIMPMARGFVQERFGPDAKEQNDMLGSFVRHGLTQRQCETEALFQILAGSDTTATAIRATLLYIMSTAAVYTTLQSTIDEGIKTGKISSPITNAEAMELPYLQGVILEGLRLHPPATIIPFKVVPPEGDTIDGKHVPGGTLIAPNIWDTGRHRGVFGPDADLFRPERWLEVGAEERAEMRRVAELVFGSGRWGCAGRMIAFMELNKVFVELLRRFDLQLANPSKPWKSVNFNIFLQSDMWVAVSLREGQGEQ